MDVMQLFKDNEKNIFFFSKKDCPYCVKLECELRALKLPYTKVVLDPSNEWYQTTANSLKEITAMNTFPMLFIGKNKVGGYNDFMSLSITNKLNDLLRDVDLKVDDEF